MYMYVHVHCWDGCVYVAIIVFMSLYTQYLCTLLTGNTALFLWTCHASYFTLENSYKVTLKYSN